MASRSLGQLTLDLIAKIGGFTGPLEKAEREADKRMKNIKKNAESVGADIGKAIGAGTAAFITGKLASDFIEVNKQFQSLNASLVTVTGSTEAAGKAFASLQHFAATTPYQLTEITGAFIKMKALGLDPTESTLKSFGNTAAAMGKGLNQFVEAVADAATGEFERLKEFGIKASSQGDKVALTFQGVTTTVQKSAEDIASYLEGIGNVQFAGAMERQMDTLGGALSNLADAYDNLLFNAGNAGEANELLRETITDLSDLLSQPSTADALAVFATGVATIAKEVVGLAVEMNRGISVAAQWAAALSMGDISLWEYITTGKEGAAARLAQIESARGIFDKSSDAFVGPMQQSSTQPAKAKRGPAQGKVDAAENKRAAKEALDYALDIQEAMNDVREGAIKEAMEMTIAMQDLMDELRTGAAGDYKELMDSLLTTEEALVKALREKADIIANAPGLSDEERAQSRAKLVADTFGTPTDDVESEQEKLVALREAMLITQEEYDAREIELLRKKEDQKRQIMAASAAAQLDAGANFFGQLSALAAAHAGKDSKAYKALFAIEKGFAVASATIKMWQAVSAAAASGVTPADRAANMAAALAQFGTILSSLKSVSEPQGMAHDGIDSVPQSGTWLLEKGERVVTAQTSAKLDATLDDIKDTGNKAPVVNLIEDSSKAGKVESRQDERGWVLDMFVADLMGDGKTKKAMAQKFGLSGVGA